MENVLKPFRKEQEEKYHMEDRFDEKTGKKVSEVKIIDQQAVATYTYNGKDYREFERDLLEALSEDLGCTIADGGGYSDGTTAYVSVSFVTDGSGEDYGRVDTGGKATLDEISICKAKCMSLKQELNKLGVSGLGDAVVYIRPRIS